MQRNITNTILLSTTNTNFDSDLNSNIRNINLNQ